MINLKQLHIFTVVAKTGELTAAGEVLNMTTSAVSINLKMLEQRLDTHLVQRARGRKSRSQRVTLTESGEWLLDRAETMLSLSTGTERYFAQLKHSRPRSLCIGASQTVGNYWLPGYLSELKKHYPKLTLNIHISNTEDILGRVQTFQDDIGLVEGPNTLNELDSRCFKKDSMTLITAPGEHTANLSTLPWLIRESGSATRQLTEKLWQELEIKPDNTVQMNTNESIIHAVAMGAGVAYVPRIATSLMLEANLLHELPVECTSVRSLYWVTHRDTTDAMQWVNEALNLPV